MFEGKLLAQHTNEKISLVHEHSLQILRAARAKERAGQRRLAEVEYSGSTPLVRKRTDMGVVNETGDV